MIRMSLVERPRRAGFSIMELMVTMSIAAMLLGLGVGVFMSAGRTTAYRQALGDVEGLISKARNASSRHPAAIVVDATNREIHGLTQRIVQELHFEPRPQEDGTLTFVSGIDGLTCDTSAGRLEPQGGRVGGGLRLDGGSVPCGDFAAYEVTDGLTAELWLKPDTSAACDVVSKGDTLLVKLGGAGAGRARLTVKLGLSGEGGPDKTEQSVDVPAPPPGEWTGIFVSYDREALTIATDYGYGPIVQLRWTEEHRRLLVDPTTELVVAQGFVGTIDDFRFGGIHVHEPVRMPQGVKIEGSGAPRTIRFRGGRLDPDKHQGSERIVIVGPQVSTSLEIAPNGMLTKLENAAAVVAPAEGTQTFKKDE